MGMRSQASCFCGGGTGLELAGPLLLEAERLLSSALVRPGSSDRGGCTRGRARPAAASGTAGRPLRRGRSASRLPAPPPTLRGSRDFSKIGPERRVALHPLAFVPGSLEGRGRRS